MLSISLFRETMFFLSSCCDWCSSSTSLTFLLLLRVRFDRHTLARWLGLLHLRHVCPNAFGPLIVCPGLSTVSTVMLYLLSIRLIVIVVASELCECASGLAVVASEISAVP